MQKKNQGQRMGKGVGKGNMELRNLAEMQNRHHTDIIMTETHDDCKYPGAYKVGKTILAVTRPTKEAPQGEWRVAEIYGVREGQYFSEHVTNEKAEMV